MLLRLVIMGMVFAGFLHGGARDADASRFTGAYLIRLCGVNEQGQEIAPGAHGACQSYISAIIDYHNMLRSMKMAPEINFCVPSQVSLNEIHLYVLEYMEKNPQHDSFVAAPAVLMALYQKYPCGRKGR